MKTECNVCMHRCQLSPGQMGICGARANEKGIIVCQNYGKVTALALDPIEKKPLRRFFPGSFILSAGSYGCNMNCPFCQNHQIAHPDKGISQESTAVQIAELQPETLTEKALELKAAGNIGIAFTYNEPLVGFEFVRDTAELARRRGLKTVAVTNGAFSEKTAEAILPCLDALNIDLKGFTSRYYEMLGGSLDMVKAFICQAAQHCHIELTTLIVPGQNDSEQEMRQLSSWVASVSPEIPLHITRFFPCWKMEHLAPTPVEHIFKLADIAGEQLKYVFIGNC